MSGARDQVARLLALVPYLQARREVRLEEAAARLRGQPGADRQGPQRAVVLRAARPRHGRPDRRRHGRARGRGRDPAVQRRLPRPAAAAGQLRGVRADRRAAGAARGQRRRRPRDRRPHAGQARGRRRRRPPPSPRRWTSGARAGRPARRAARPARPGASTTAGRCGSTTTCRPATRPPSGSSTRCGWSPPTATPTSTPGATAPRTSGCSGSTGSPSAEVLDTPVEEHADLEPRDLADGIFQPSTDDLLVTLRLEPERPLGGGVLPGRGRPREARGGGLTRAAAGRRPAPGCPADAAARRRRPSWSTRPSWRQRSPGGRPGAAQLRLTASSDGRPAA